MGPWTWWLAAALLVAWPNAAKAEKCSKEFVNGIVQGAQEFLKAKQEDSFERSKAVPANVFAAKGKILNDRYSCSLSVPDARKILEGVYTIDIKKKYQEEGDIDLLAKYRFERNRLIDGLLNFFEIKRGEDPRAENNKIIMKYNKKTGSRRDFCTEDPGKPEFLTIDEDAYPALIHVLMNMHECQWPGLWLDDPVTTVRMATTNSTWAEKGCAEQFTRHVADKLKKSPEAKLDLDQAALTAGSLTVTQSSGQTGKWQEPVANSSGCSHSPDKAIFYMLSRNQTSTILQALFHTDSNQSVGRKDVKQRAEKLLQFIPALKQDGPFFRKFREAVPIVPALYSPGHAESLVQFVPLRAQARYDPNTGSENENYFLVLVRALEAISGKTDKMDQPSMDSHWKKTAALVSKLPQTTEISAVDPANACLANYVSETLGKDDFPSSADKYQCEAGGTLPSSIASLDYIPATQIIRKVLSFSGDERKSLATRVKDFVFGKVSILQDLKDMIPYEPRSYEALASGQADSSSFIVDRQQAYFADKEGNLHRNFLLPLHRALEAIEKGKTDPSASLEEKMPLLFRVEDLPFLHSFEPKEPPSNSDELDKAHELKRVFIKEMTDASHKLELAGFRAFKCSSLVNLMDAYTMLASRVVMHLDTVIKAETQVLSRVRATVGAFKSTLKPSP